MNTKREPTNGENVTSRLFVRFFLCYLISAPVAWLLAMRGGLNFDITQIGTVEFLFIPLALLGGLLTVSKPYLLALSVGKAFFDMSFLYRMTVWTRMGNLGFLPWNACFFLLVFSLLLFAFSAARGALFSFLTTARDARLIFSRPFGGFMLEVLVFTALALTQYYLWPQILTKFGMLPMPF